MPERFDEPTRSLAEPGLDALPGSLPAPPLDALHARLIERAAANDLLDVAYRRLDTGLGTLLLAATPAGLVSVTFDGDDPDATLERLAATLSPRVLEAPARLDDAARALERLIGGSARSFDGALDLTLAHGFGRQVVERLREIPYGETRSYAQVAQAVGSPKAVRAVGTACRKNPLPIAVPCHRVVRSDGGIGQYAGGVEAKRLLLTIESAA
ncbi:methylated-DNA--[protein]-cysteine S-methyltransferase [Agrococcus sp. ARC_14]|uniref:methylated-DNA--[protein]-cysteine S-methyltransferase n=1 Tax=Agrococcus sp. ARC_14 TaxID=2919927 RepID=UPI001F068115|nr:methylated-DNA--[protein]-cysteine S-methyltransferase [Agrococcus sp. ARC_14]MCH1882093.1 methylated-DNA--[protein]-cysteine S-methyltransferase [Agrococcus sp. ARC_14]